MASTLRPRRHHHPVVDTAASHRPVSAVPRKIAAPADRPGSMAWLMDWTPLLWVLGALTILQAGVILRLVARRWPRGVVVNVVAAAWIGIGLMQMVAALLNGLLQNVPATGVRNLLSLTATGWIFGGLGIAAGAAHGLDDPRTVRSTTRLGLYVLLLAALAAVLAQTLHRPFIALFETPMARLLPSSDVTIFYASAQLYLQENTFGDSVVRLVLFFPWTTGLGLGGLSIFFISMLESDRRWRLTGMAGGLVAITFSWSRIAQLSLILSLVLLLFMRLSRRWRLLCMILFGFAFVLLRVCGLHPIGAITDARSAVDAARSGSSFARDLIYQKSWEGFLESPLIGKGWVGPSVHAKEILPIGSHSTVYGTLYTGGLITFGSFVVAMLATAAGLVYQCAVSPRGSTERSRAMIGLSLLVCLIAYSPVEALYSLTLPCCFLFTFLGAVLGRRQPDVGFARPELRNRAPRRDP